MTNKIKQYVTELQNVLIFAGLIYDVWWIFNNRESRKKLIEPLTLYYPNFIITSSNAYLVALIVASYRVFETRHDTFNMPNLIKLIKKEEIVRPDNILRFEGKLKNIKQIWIKISILRNEMFAHKSNSLATKAIWRKAGLTPDALKCFIEDSKILLNEITEARFNSGHIFGQSASEDTKSLLEDLNTINRDGP